MRFLKTLGAAIVAAAALAAFVGAGSASATVICSTEADPCPAGQAWPNGTAIDFSIPSGSSASLTDTSGNSLDKCTTSTVEGSISNTGSSTDTVTMIILGLTWGNCTFTTKTVSTGIKFKVHKIPGTKNGTMTSDSQLEVTINTGLFGSCIYGVATTRDLGQITFGKSNISLHLNMPAKRFGSNFACPQTALWTGTYVLTTPSSTTLSVSESGS